MNVRFPVGFSAKEVGKGPGEMNPGLISLTRMREK